MNVGERIRRVRREKGLTLKAAESLSGVSAAHLSEIERGVTSPTMGSLVRIARALAKSTAYFLEENELGEISLVNAKDRVREVAGRQSGQKGSSNQTMRASALIERLTIGIPGGRLHARRVELPVDCAYRTDLHSHSGFEAIVVLHGRVRARAGESTVELAAGDAMHFDASLPHAYANASHSEPAGVVWIATRRDVE